MKLSKVPRWILPLVIGIALGATAATALPRLLDRGPYVPRKSLAMLEKACSELGGDVCRLSELVRNGRHDLARLELREACHGTTGWYCDMEEMLRKEWMKDLHASETIAVPASNPS